MTNDLQIGDVVQIDPAHDDVFGGAFMVVTEPKTWGAQGYVHCLKPGHVAYYRCKHESMELIGQAIWAIEQEEVTTDASHTS